MVLKADRSKSEGGGQVPPLLAKPAAFPQVSVTPAPPVGCSKAELCASSMIISRHSLPAESKLLWIALGEHLSPLFQFLCQTLSLHHSLYLFFPPDMEQAGLFSTLKQVAGLLPLTDLQTCWLVM